MPPDTETSAFGRFYRRWSTVGWRALIVLTALIYFSALVLLPSGIIFYNTFAKGFEAFWEGATAAETLHAAKLTLSITAIVVPLNTLFGLAAAWVLARQKFIGKIVAMALINVPLAMSPIVAGLFIVLVYSPTVGLFKSAVVWADVKVLFAFPGLVIATLFITLPFVVREILPSLEATDRAEEEAANSLGASQWQIFWRVVFPAIRWSVIYGVIICIAKSIGEFGAVSSVSGKLIGETNTLTLHVERAYAEYETAQAYAAATMLSLVALVTVILQLLIPAGHTAKTRKK